MTELKRPERYVKFESIKPELKEITEFYTSKVTDYQYRLKKLNEYADALENEISVLKEKPKVEVLLDNMAKQLAVVPQFVADFIEVKKGKLKILGAFREITQNHGGSELYRWVFASVDSQELFARAWIDGYTVEKEQLFYLKNKNTGHILYRQPKEVGGNLIEVVATINEEYTWFTQDEIDTMHIGSYEQIEVEP